MGALGSVARSLHVVIKNTKKSKKKKPPSSFYPTPPLYPARLAAPALRLKGPFSAVRETQRERESSLSLNLPCLLLLPESISSSSFPPSLSLTTLPTCPVSLHAPPQQGFQETCALNYALSPPNLSLPRTQTPRPHTSIPTSLLSSSELLTSSRCTPASALHQTPLLFPKLETPFHLISTTLSINPPPAPAQSPSRTCWWDLILSIVVAASLPCLGRNQLHTIRMRLLEASTSSRLLDRLGDAPTSLLCFQHRHYQRGRLSAKATRWLDLSEAVLWGACLLPLSLSLRF